MALIDADHPLPCSANIMLAGRTMLEQVSLRNFRGARLMEELGVFALFALWLSPDKSHWSLRRPSKLLPLSRLLFTL